jgi:ATP synthase protein I
LFSSTKNELVKPGRKFAYQQIGLSIIIVILCSLMSYMILGSAQASSVLAGGAIGILPNYIFALKAFKYAGATASKLVVESFFSGVKLKMLVTAVLFALAFKFLAILPIAFFTSYCMVMALPLLTPFIFKQS